jgi:hypothetical protein
LVADRYRNQPKVSNSNKWLGKTIDEALDLYRLADAHVHISEGDSPILFMVGEHVKPERNAASRKKLKAHGIFSDVNIYKNGKHGCWNRLPWFKTMADDMDAFFHEQLR